MLTKSATYDAFLEGQATKSAKIRALARAGVPTAEIARHLGIRYQHARNVIKDAGLSGTAQPEGMSEESTAFVQRNESLSSQHTWAQLGKGGELMIPNNLLSAVGLAPGDFVFVNATEDSLELLSRRASMARVQKNFLSRVPEGVSVVDEFIADRRREAAEDDAKWEREHTKWRRAAE